MENAETILVIFLSTALLLFITLGIIAMVKINKILGHLESISEKADHIAGSAEAIGDYFKHGAQSMSIAKLLGNIHDTVFKSTKKSKSEGKKK